MLKIKVSYKMHLKKALYEHVIKCLSLNICILNINLMLVNLNKFLFLLKEVAWYWIFSYSQVVTIIIRNAILTSKDIYKQFATFY